MFQLKESMKEQLVRIFKIDKTLLFVIIADILFYLCLAGSLYSLNLIMIDNFKSLESTYSTLEKLSSIYNGDAISSAESFTAELESTQNILRKVLINSAIISIIFYFLIITLISLIKGFIWSRISSQRFSFRYFLKSWLLNLLWVSFWCIILASTIILFKANINYYIVALELLLFIYSSSVIRALFNEKESLFSQIKKGIKSCFKFRKLPLLCLFISFIIFALIYYLMLFVSQGITFVVIVLIMLALYSALARRYILDSLRLV